MKPLTVEISSILPFIKPEELQQVEAEIGIMHQILLHRNGKGNEFLGWLDLPSGITQTEIERIETLALKLRNLSEVIVVIGIGGSYLGAKSIIEALQNPFGPMEIKNPKVIYAGHHLSEDYMASLLQFLDTKAYSIVIISKSGTTTEPAIAFRLLKKHIENKYGKANAAERIVAITDEYKGALKQMAKQEGYETFVIPDNVGGRFSVLTPVGLLPICLAGFSIKELIKGALEMEVQLKANDASANNPAILYAAARNVLYRNGKPIELLVNFEPALTYFTEWWKQLYGESEGKEHRGIFPAGVNFTTDLHSMGQYIQEGMRVIFETILSVEKAHSSVQVPFDEADVDGINFMSGKSLTEINRVAEAGTLLAHVSGGVPCINITIPTINEYYLGQLIYFFEFACALSGYVLDVNPFDQPGVEAYKNNMFALLGKPGYENMQEALLAKLKK